ncbi:MAG: nucleotidyltransferase family protein [Chloroflexota bacterium]
MSPRDGTVAGLILAAGRSLRLGRPKQTLAFGNGTLLDHAVAQAESVDELTKVIVVLPPGDGVPAPLVTRSRVVRVEHEGACSSSLHAGLRALPDAVDAIAILPADQPGVSATLISLAVRSWLRSRPAGLTLSYRGEPGHPLVFAATLRDALGTLHGDKAMWHLLENLGDAVERIPVDVPCPQDIDTLEDYRSVLALAGHEG